MMRFLADVKLHCCTEEEANALAANEVYPKYKHSAPFMKEHRKVKNWITAKLSRKRRAVFLREIEHNLQLAHACIT